VFVPQDNLRAGSLGLRDHEAQSRGLARPDSTADERVTDAVDVIVEQVWTAAGCAEHAHRAAPKASLFPSREVMQAGEGREVAARYGCLPAAQMKIARNL